MSLSRRNEQSHQTPENQGEGADTKMQEAERSHAQELTDIFKESWEEHRKEGDPKVSFKIFFDMHTWAEDAAPNLREELERADVYFPENFEWTKEEMEELNRLSSGQAPHSYPLSGYAVAILAAVRGTGVVVASPDLPAGDPLNKDIQTDLQNLDKDRSQLDYDEAVQDFEIVLHDMATSQGKREKEIVRNIPRTLREIIDTDEDLRTKEELSVIMTYGNIHTSLHHALSRAGANVSREMRHHPDDIYTHHTELIRRHLFGLEESPQDHELAARGLMRKPFLRAIGGELYLKDTTTGEALYVVRRAVEQFSIEELGDLWEAYRAEEDPSMIRTELAAKGFTIPKTREELDELMQSIRNPESHH